MDAYPLDLRKKIVEAKARGIPTAEVANLRRGRLFGQALRRRGARRKIPRPEEAPRIQAQTGRGSEEAVGSGPPGASGRDAAREAREFLRRAAGVEVSDSTVSRMLKRLGWTRKKDRWVRASATSS